MTKIHTPIEPVGFRVVIRQNVIEEKTETGIILNTDKEQKRKQLGHTEGVLVAVGGAAFTGEDWGAKDRETLKPGTRVKFNRYAGQTVESKEYQDEDGVTALFHICADSDVHGILNESAQLENFRHL